MFDFLKKYFTSKSEKVCSCVKPKFEKISSLEYAFVKEETYKCTSCDTLVLEQSKLKPYSGMREFRYFP
ncbi:MAG: hypothetical protein AB7V77_01395 [Candidatus Woesearchaeota archaeon]